MASSTFEFVQGNERLDWGVLVSIDVERLMKSTNVETLQRIVENIAFSRITRDEAAMFTPDHILHLFQLCQVLIQYLVHSQEILAKMNVKLNDRMTAQQDTAQEREGLLQRLSDEASLLKKQVKTQRRTLLAYEYNAQAALARGVAGSGSAAAGVPATPYVCPFCGEEYHKAESMQSHLRKRHNTAAAPAKMQVGETATSPPSLPTACGCDRNYGDRSASPMPPAVGAQSAVPAAAGAPIANAEAAESLQQLRLRVEQLEKDKDVLERQQRENLILMMLGATRSQQASPPQQSASLPPNTSAQPLASPLPPPPPPSSPLPGLAATPSEATVTTAVKAIPENLQGVPVVPDISAMMNYNLSCQREASENALRRQLVDLEAEIRALKANRPAAASTMPTQTSLPPPPSPSRAATDTGPSATSATAPGSGVVASNAVAAAVRPAQAAELERTQNQQQPQHPSISAGGPSLAPPLTPPPAPLPPPPQAVAIPTLQGPKQSSDNATGLIVPSLVQPPPHSQPPSSQSQSTSSAAAPIAAFPSPSVPAPLQSSSPAPLSSYGVVQQLQQPLSAVAPPTPTVSGLSTTAAVPLPPSPSTATTALGGASPTTASTPTPSVGLPQPSKVSTRPYYWVDSSTSSSFASASTAPPSRGLSKGPPYASLSHLSSTQSSPLMVKTPGALGNATPATVTSAPNLVPTLPSPSTTYLGPVVAPLSSSEAGIGSYFSSRVSASAAAVPALPLDTAPRSTTLDSITSNSSNHTTQRFTHTALRIADPPLASSSTYRSPPPLATPSQPAPPHSTSFVALQAKSAAPSHAPSSLAVPVVAGGTGGNGTTVSPWLPQAPVPSTASMPVPAAVSAPGAVRSFRPLSSSSSSSG
ncbi:hypothetical protein JKF63_06688 [Porcisia hertigi]|uniref:C2H2-type domain-containing protein n=1 Tax=Porcisia hertigi TaxID=2761500 RepID=A0A836LIW4_9TRYP|nr:hypothetical protein JKF63_06688 [Porcisia hertigi]